MTSEPGVDHPEEQTEAEITLIGRGISVSSRVEVVQGDFISVRPSVGEFVEQVVVKVGDAVEVFWKNATASARCPPRSRTSSSRVSSSAGGCAPPGRPSTASAARRSAGG